MDRCPGGDTRNIRAEDVTCPTCGTSVELFSDEQRRTCPTCGTRVARVTAPTCATWCGAAEKCLGTKGGKNSE